MLGYRKDVMQLLLELRHAGVNAVGLGFKSTPAGIESDEVAGFIGRLSMGGYLIQESPIRLTPYGVDLVSSEISENLDDPSVQKAMSILGLTVQDLATATTTTVE
jgi:hypothetical protein